MMNRTLSFFFIVGILVWISFALTDQPGLVSLEWAGWKIDTSFAVLLAFIAIISLAVALAYRFFLFLRNSPKEIKARWYANRRDRGYKALTRGMVAVAAGDSIEAQNQATLASNLLDEPPLTLLISAQAAQMRGDETAAIKFFTAMVNRSDTEFLGLRGLYNQAIKRGDKAEALTLARRAYRLDPKSTWVANDMFSLQISNGQWLDAKATANDLLHRKLIDSKAEKRIRAVINYQLSEEARVKGDQSSSKSYLQDSLKLAPGLVPAAINLAIELVNNKKVKRAKKILEKSWTTEPHPSLLNSYFIASNVESPMDKLQAIKNLTIKCPDHHESLIALAQVSLEAQLWGEARQFLEKAIEKVPSPTRKVCEMMAELEESENSNQELSREWLFRASQAIPEAVWVCNYCGIGDREWSTTCKKCGEFDSYFWRSPPSDFELFKTSTIEKQISKSNPHSQLLNADIESIHLAKGFKNN